MYYLPGTRWYIAELIEETSIGGFPRQIIQHNARFIFAHSPEEAYDQALALGHQSASQPPEEQVARTRYWGLAHLNVVQEDLRNAQSHLEKPVPMYQIPTWPMVNRHRIGIALD